MTQIFERFLDEMDEVIENTNIKYEDDICDASYDNNASCECVCAGSDMYFDTSMGQWYPEENSEFEVDGYDDYIDEIVTEIANEIAQYYNTQSSEELKADVKSQLTDIFQNCVLSESAFEDKAIDDYIS